MMKRKQPLNSLSLSVIYGVVRHSTGLLYLLLAIFSSDVEELLPSSQPLLALIGPASDLLRKAPRPGTQSLLRDKPAII